MTADDRRATAGRAARRRATRSSSSTTSTPTTATSTPCRASTLDGRRAARSSPSSAPTAPARRRPSRRSAACSTRARARSPSTARTSRRPPPHELVEPGIGHAPEGRRIFSPADGPREPPDGRLHARPPRTIARGHRAGLSTLFPRLRERTHQQGGTLSGGEQQMLAIGRALMSRPQRPAPRRAVARPRADPRPADLRDHQGDQRARARRSCSSSRTRSRRSTSRIAATCSRPAASSSPTRRTR